MEQTTTFYHFLPHFSKKTLNIVYIIDLNAGYTWSKEESYGKLNYFITN